MDCYIFCAGEFHGLVKKPEPGDIVIAADGGLGHTRALGLDPDVILGDFDSLGYVPEGAQVFPAEKDDTDCILAIKEGLARGAGRFFIYGGLEGSRLEHTLANLQSLLYLAKAGVRGYLVGKHQIVTTVWEETVIFPETCRGYVSFFAFGEKARGITLEGLHYPLQEGTLQADFPLGVSNHFTGQKASCQVRSGCLIGVYERENGILW